MDSAYYEEKNKREHMLHQLFYQCYMEGYEEIFNSLKVKSFQVVLISELKPKYDIVQMELFIRCKLERTIDLIKINNNIAIVFYDEYSQNRCSLRMIQQQIKNELNGNVCITIGERVNTINEIYASYKTAEMLMERKYFWGNRCVCIDDYSDKWKVDIEDGDVVERIYTYIELGEGSEINNMLLELKERLNNSGLSESFVKAIIATNCMKIVNQIFEEYKINKKYQSDYKEIIKYIFTKETLDETIVFLKERFIQLSKVIAVEHTDSTIKRVVKYVDSKYYGDLKLEGLAEIFNYNSSYLGKVFKEYTGKSFNSYLDHIRIEQAKKILLSDKVKIREVSKSVGFRNIDYFYNKFKKYVGVSPMNYKKSLIKEQ